MKKIPKIILIIFLVIFILQMLALLVLLFTPLFAQAQGALDPTCWTQDLCEKQGVWEEDKITCGNGWGRCYPKTSPIPLQITLQGQKEVTDVAEYIALIYKYTVGIGAVLAVAVIIWGGVIYLTAGGLPDKISQAKEYISNAVIGLVLLYTSYLLLQTLNPDLVKLRMPRVYMIRPLTLGATFCEDLAPEGRILKDLGGFAEAKKEEPPPISFPLGPGDLDCNKQYYWAKGGEKKCWGKRCEKKDGERQLCMPIENPSPEKQFECKKGEIGVIIQYSGGAWVDYAWLYMVVRKGNLLSVRKLDSVDLSEEKKQTGTQNFFFSLLEPLGYYAQEKEFKGFFIVVEIDDPGTLALDDSYALGKSYDQPLSFTTKEGKSFTDASLFVSGPVSTLLSFQINESDLLQTHDFLQTRSYQLNRTNFPTR